MSHLAHRAGVKRRPVILALAVMITCAMMGTAQTAWAATTRVVVANSGDNTVAIFDLATGTAMIVLDGSNFSSPRWVAITPDGRFAGVTNAGSDTITWIDLTKSPPLPLGTTQVFPAGASPTGIAIKDKKAVVAVDASPGNDDWVNIIDLSTSLYGPAPTPPGIGDITALDLGTDTDPEGVDITPDRKFALVAQTGDNSVAVVDLTTFGFVPGSPTPTGGGTQPFGVAITFTPTRRALVTNRGNSRLSVINLNSLYAVAPTAPAAGDVALLVIGNTPQGVAIIDDGSKAIIAEAGSADDVRTMNIPAFTSSTLPVGDNPFGVATSITPSGYQAAISNELDDSISILDLATSSIAFIALSVGSNPQGLAITPVQAPSCNLRIPVRSGRVPLTTALDGCASKDDDGTIASYTFDPGDGTGPQTVATCAIDPYVYTTPGNFTATLVVTDDDGVTSRTCQQSVGVGANKPPVANLRASPTKGKVGLVVTLDGSRSSDSDGTIASYTFDCGNGTTPAPQVAASMACTYSSAGKFTASLVVTDNSGTPSTNRATVSIEVVPNKPPVANLRAASSTKGKAGLVVTLDGARSSDPDGTIALYTFDCGNGATPAPQAAASMACTYSSVGKFTATLVVTDDSGAPSTNKAAVSIEIVPNKPPVANFDARQAVSPAHTMNFTDRSQDSDGTVVAWSWDFGDLGVSSLKNPVHPYATAGTFTVVLTVTDNNGATALITRRVSVR